MDQLKLIALGLSLFAGLHDAFTARIPNWLTFPGILLGLIAQYYWGGTPQLFAGFGGLTVGLLLYAPLFFLHIMGAGDAKLLMLIGAFTDWRFTIYVAGFSIILGGAYAFMDTLSRGRILIVFHAIRGFLFGFLRPKEANMFIDTKRKFSFGFVMALGLWLTIILQQRGIIL
jgi:prepilin peptidase CpaA